MFARSYVWFPADKMGDGLADQERAAASEGEWGRVDSLYRDVSAELQLAVYMLLTDGPAEKAAEHLYVILEPFANVVLAVDRERGEASICADWWMWRVFEAEFRGLQEHAGSIVRAGRTIDALVESLHRLRALLGGEWQVRHSYDAGERAVITQGNKLCVRGEALSLRVEASAPLPEPCIAHFAVPAAKWWDDIVYT